MSDFMVTSNMFVRLPCDRPISRTTTTVYELEASVKTLGLTIIYCRIRNYRPIVRDIEQQNPWRRNNDGERAIFERHEKTGGSMRRRPLS
jgi:hypothetical protein